VSTLQTGLESVASLGGGERTAPGDTIQGRDTRMR